MSMFISTRGFQKYSPFFEPPHVAPQIGRRSSPQLGFRRTIRRAFPATSDVSGENRHHHEVDLVVLYAVLPFFSRIHHCFIVSLTFLPLFRRGHPWTASTFLRFGPPRPWSRSPPRHHASADPQPRRTSLPRLASLSSRLLRAVAGYCSGKPVHAGTARAAGSSPAPQPRAHVDWLCRPAVRQRLLGRGPSLACIVCSSSRAMVAMFCT